MQKVYSVGQINTYIQTMFTQDFVLNRVSVRQRGGVQPSNIILPGTFIFP